MTISAAPARDRNERGMLPPTARRRGPSRLLRAWARGREPPAHAKRSMWSACGAPRVSRPLSEDVRPMSVTAEDWDARVTRLSEKMPDTLRRGVDWLREPSRLWLRLIAALLLIL